MLMNPWHKLEKLCAHTGRTLLRVARFSYYVRHGVAHRYPLCCILHFAWDASNPKLLRREHRLTHGPAVKRGSIFAGMRTDGRTPKRYVPCKFHMGRHPNWTPWQRGQRRHQLQLFWTEPKR
jgi:hypothetical protein